MLLVILILIVLEAFCIGTVSAATNTSNATITELMNDTKSYAIVSYDDVIQENQSILDILSNANPLNKNKENLSAPSERIVQGQCVEIGKYYDIGGIGWWSGKIGYYGRYTDAYAPPNSSLVSTIDVPYNTAKLRHFYIDPEKFEGKTGYWYSIYDYIGDEDHANNRLFYVSTNCSVYNKKKPSEIVNVSAIKNETEQYKNKGLLPPKTGDGFIIARGDPFVFYDDFKNDSRIWLFGEYDGIYGRDTNNGNVVFTGEETKNLHSGIYTLDIHDSGNNNIFEVKYVNESLVSPFVDGVVFPITFNYPQEIKKEFENYTTTTIDDKYKTYLLDIDDPKIYVARIDSTDADNNLTFVEIRGYTNLAVGKQISVILEDEFGNGNYKPVSTKVVGENVTTAWRQFAVVMLINLEETKPGHNTLDVYSEGVIDVTVPIYVRREQPSSYVPPKYVSFIDNDPYIAPVIVEKIVEKEVVKTVIQEKIVMKEWDYEKIAAEYIRQLAPIVIGGAIATVAAIYSLWVLVRIVERRKRNVVSSE